MTVASSLALVTGSTQGIGLAVAKELATKHNYHVLLGVRNTKAGEQIASDLRSEGHKVDVVELDLTSSESIDKAVAHIEQKYGYLDVLINNAGVLLDWDKDLTTWDIYHKTFTTNVIGTGCLTKGLLPLLRQAKTNPPRIIFVTSVMGSLEKATDESLFYYNIDYKVYDASKAAVNMLMFNFAREMDDVGGKVNSVCPGLVKTGLSGYHEMGTAPEVGAERIVELATTTDKKGPHKTISNSNGELPSTACARKVDEKVAQGHALLAEQLKQNAVLVNRVREYPETSESLGTSFDFNDLMVDWVSSPSTISATQPITVYRDTSFWNISSDLQISMPPKSLSAKGDLTRVSNRLSSLQHASRIVMQMLYSYPRMMLRRQTFPPFIHPHWHQEHLPEALGNCMSIARLFESRTPETVPFLWKTIIAEQTRFREKLGTFTPREVHLCLQVMIIYLIMAMTDSGTENRERVAKLFETVELIGSRFLDLTGSYSTSEAAEPNTTWEVWIFAESRRRMSCLWLIISCVITIENGQTHSRCDELENLALPSSKMLWEARTLDEWQMEKNIFDAGSVAMTLAMKQIGRQATLDGVFRPRSPKSKEFELPPSLPPTPPAPASPSPPASPARQERAASFISITSDENEPDVQEYTGPPLCEEQQDLVDIIMSGKNVFFTGSAGCGKSTVLKAAIAQLEAAGKTVAVTAPTGRAALNVDGITLFSFMGWGAIKHPKMSLAGLKDDICKKPNKKVRKILQATDVLIIDEVSMVENNFLTRMEAVLNHIRDQTRPWGGLQLIVTGDFCQLPPVLPFQHCCQCGTELDIPYQEADHPVDRIIECSCGHGPWNYEEDRWAFRSPAWEAAKFAYVNLKEIHRQSDRPFIEALQKCRLGIPLSSRELDMLLNHESEVENATRLVPTRVEAKKINAKKLEEITDYTSKDYTCEDGIWFPPSYDGPKDYLGERTKENTLKKFDDHRFNKKVELKQTQLVMLQVNLNLKKGLANGSQGEIVGWEKIDKDRLPSYEGKDGCLKEEHVLLFTEEYLRKFPNPDDQVWPVVRFNNGYRKTIYPVCVINHMGYQSQVLMYRTQIPLIPGWAITIHKSQGMTLDQVIVKLDKVFEVGQAYVALSRATSLRGLRIEEGNSHTLSAELGRNPEVHEFLERKFGRDLYADHAGSTI
ncbi:unnamed protein product [Fusarium graminearum]|nr:unnamed protein product [Fusarium graminearum]